MAEEKYYVSLNTFERRILVQGINHFRNDLIKEGKPTEDVDEVLLKLVDAKLIKKGKREERGER